MIRYIVAIILIGISVVGFLEFTKPFYNDISELKLQIAAYNEALDNSKALESERDKLTGKYNAIDPENLIKIQKLLPDSIDNIRLILEIEKIASPHNLVLKNVKYNTIKKETSASETGAIQGGGIAQTDQLLNRDYGSWDLEFSTSGTYNNFLNFTKDLESHLRIVDISTIQFSSGAGTKLNPSLPETYEFNFKIKTYWLKN